MPEERLREQSTHAEPARFVAIVGEIENLTGRRLRGNGRAKGLRAFNDSADGFERCARSAQRRARLNPFGLLLTMIDDEEHLLRATARVDEREQLRDAGETPPPVSVCISCEMSPPYHVDGCPEAA